MLAQTSKKYFKKEVISTEKIEEKVYANQDEICIGGLKTLIEHLFLFNFLQFIICVSQVNVIPLVVSAQCPFAVHVGVIVVHGVLLLSLHCFAVSMMSSDGLFSFIKMFFLSQ